MSPGVAPPRPRRRWRTAVLSVLAAVVLYAVIAGLVVPHFARTIIARKLGERIGRIVAIDDLAFNPFTLKATMKGFRILEPDGRTVFASFDRLDVDGSITSIYRLAPVADALDLSGLVVHLVRDGASHYNVTDILGRLAAAPKAAKPAGKTEFSVSNIRLTHGRVDFDDRPRGAKHEMTDIDLAIPFISNLPSHLKEFVQPSFSAKVNGTALTLKGETQPFENSLRTHVAIDLESLDVPRYVEYAPAALPVKVDAGKLDAHLSLRFTEAADKEPSIDVAGTLALRDVRLSAAGEPALAGVTRVDLALASLDPLAGLAHVDSLRVTQASADHGQWSVPTAEARDIRVDVEKKEVRIESLSTRDGVLAFRRGRDGALELPMHPAAAQAPPADSAPPWNVALGKLTLDGYKVALDDGSVKPAVTHRVAITHLAAAGITTQAGGKGTLTASLVLGKSGTVDLDSGFGIDPPSLDARIDARRIDLVALRPYVEQFATVALKSGNASAKGRLTVTGEGDALRVAYSGSAGVANVASVETTTGEDLLNWDSILCSGMDFQWSKDKPLHLAVTDIAVRKAYARVVVLPDGKINLQKLKFATQNGPKAPAPAPAAGETRPDDIRIDRITFADSRLNFTDHYIKPNYTADVGGLHGRVTKLSSDPASRATVDLQGSYDKTSPVSIAGTINPLSGDLFLDIAARGKDIELPKLTAYSERYAGYGITQGKLSLDVKYHVEKGKLQGRNKILIEQLVFGKKVDSPDAMQLPVLFAVNLLKDSKGAINVELPISGSLDDPQFAIGGLITQVVVGLLKKAVTSPFSLLAAAAGGDAGSGEDLAFVDFKPGSDAIDPAGAKKLDAVAKALLDRPALTIELASRVDADKDLQALKGAALLHRLEEEKRAALAAQGKAPPGAGEVTLGPGEYARYLKLVFGREKKARPVAAGAKEAAPAEGARPGPPKEPSAGEMEAFLLRDIPIGPQDLGALALRRSDQVKDYLVGKGHLPAGRVLVAPAADPGLLEKVHVSRVEFTLK